MVGEFASRIVRRLVELLLNPWPYSPQHEAENDNITNQSTNKTNDTSLRGAHISDAVNQPEYWHGPDQEQVQPQDHGQNNEKPTL